MSRLKCSFAVNQQVTGAPLESFVCEAASDNCIQLVGSQVRHCFTKSTPCTKSKPKNYQSLSFLDCHTQIMLQFSTLLSSKCSSTYFLEAEFSLAVRLTPTKSSQLPLSSQQAKISLLPNEWRCLRNYSLGARSKSADVWHTGGFLVCFGVLVGWLVWFDLLFLFCFVFVFVTAVTVLFSW